jgi:hypothetical protein
MVKYTPELLADIKQRLETQSPQEIAQALEISERSLIAKLSSMGLYRKQPYVTKMGTPSIRKSTLVEEIATLCGEDPLVFDSLEKCNKSVLQLLIKHLTT